MREVVDEVAMQRTKDTISKQELAIKVLQEDYEGMLDDHDMVKAARVLEVFEKAYGFTEF